MWDTNGRKIKHFLVNMNRKRKKSNDKHQKAIEWYILILKKEVKEGETKWVYKTKERALARIKRYGITKHQIIKTMERKWLNDLLSKVQ